MKYAYIITVCYLALLICDNAEALDVNVSLPSESFMLGEAMPFAVMIANNESSPIDIEDVSCSIGPDFPGDQPGLTIFPVFPSIESELTLSEILKAGATSNSDFYLNQYIQVDKPGIYKLIVNINVIAGATNISFKKPLTLKITSANLNAIRTKMEALIKFANGDKPTHRSSDIIELLYFTSPESIPILGDLFSASKPNIQSLMIENAHLNRQLGISLLQEFLRRSNNEQDIKSMIQGQLDHLKPIDK